jgi:hypothetical protein
MLLSVHENPPIPAFVVFHCLSSFLLLFVLLFLVFVPKAGEVCGLTGVRTTSYEEVKELLLVGVSQYLAGGSHTRVCFGFVL